MLTFSKLFPYYSLSQGGTNYDDDDDTGSIASERSSFSLSSEVSVMPYATAKFPNPITVSVQATEESVHLC